MLPVIFCYHNPINYPEGRRRQQNEGVVSVTSDMYLYL